ncbi:hypothetical protein [Marinomonas spartinae]|uniref:hypothetical protein n=1 Tax=Marinomonas spartinae TaxID=1792290 RepID=UPI0018F1F113|nr:hypothetical protein [Marinomonas spartinae]MBJ7556757.1 hypothetical protein [Marinomonas spartinae]
MRLFITTVLLSVLLAGCSTSELMQGHHVSNVDPDVRIAKTAKIKIQGSPKGDELTNKRYIPNVIASFNALGYKNVSTDYKHPDYILTINFHSSEKKKDLSVPIFNDVNDGYYTTCSKPKGTNQEVNCVRTERTVTRVTGYRTVTAMVSVYTFDFNIKDNKGAPVLVSSSSLENETCSKWKVFAFLAKEAVAKTSFTNPMDQGFTVKMPENYQCKADDN